MAQEFGEPISRPSFAATARPIRMIPLSCSRPNDFADWLRVDGLVSRPSDFSLEGCGAMRSRTQITRHDCVEGWSAIGSGPACAQRGFAAAQRSESSIRRVLLRRRHGRRRPLLRKRRPGRRLSPQTYSPTHSMVEATHCNGAPLRVRIERQLG